MQAKIDVVSADDYDKLVTEKTAAAINAWQAKTLPSPRRREHARRPVPIALAASQPAVP